jgi:hypothetical protein
MAYFAQIDENNIVTQVLSVHDSYQHRGSDFLANDLGLGGTWIQTSFNSRGGIHYIADTNTPSGKLHLRYNFAGIGYTYDQHKDAFIPPKPYESWMLNEETCLWQPPVPYPDDENLYIWNETDNSWDIVENK